MNPLVPIYAVFASEMAAVDAELHRALLSSRYSPAIRNVSAYLLAKPGKRLRPLLTVAAYRALAPDCPVPNEVIKLAAAIELIHIASLVHDDVIDAAEFRHDQPALHQKFGIEVAIPVGVLLYSISLNLLTQVGHIDVIAQVSRAVGQLCSGELDQVLRRNDFNLSVPQYLLILKKKTSALFSLAAWGGATLANADGPLPQSLFHFGNALGLLFQVTDDLLDFAGHKVALQKGANQDFILGEITLPLIFLLQSLSVVDKERAIRIMETRDLEGLGWLSSQIKHSSVVGECGNLIRHYRDRCLSVVSPIPANPFAEILKQIVGVVADRGLVF